ncbi:transposase (plasmid) [Sinorhizobium fredii NGR234]|uniref:Transposase n=1 Tax=Sinorhizobium fredii (strain NBRC 101917 / NGR234) TaxID=394 RepID=C3KQG1_SINFN|nr:transposase [Sinorhizobium fredii]ACP22319.1 transposase [Sinorhizobium fredii NGR234]
MEDADLHRRPAITWRGRALYRQRADEPAHLRDLDRNATRPALSPGDVVILDNVGFHKSERAEQMVKAKGAWLLFLPPYSPDLNPIEMAFSKLKALLRKRAARSFDAIADALGDICNLFSVTECRNYFNAAGYEAD